LNRQTGEVRWADQPKETVFPDRVNSPSEMDRQKNVLVREKIATAFKESICGVR
jgi:hypothetical protein